MEETTATSIYDCLWLFTKSEILQGENGYLCEKCSHLLEDPKKDEPMEEGNLELEFEKPSECEDLVELKENVEKISLKETTPLEKETLEPLDLKEETEVPLEKKVVEELPKEEIVESIQDNTPSASVESIEKVETFKIPRKASKQFSFLQTPKVLTLHLKRFKQDSKKSFKKDSSTVKFPFHLSMDCFLNPLSKESKNSQNYELYAVVEHSGGIGSGHYICYVKKLILKKDGSFERHKWFRISDSNTKEASEKEVSSAEAYILFYEKVEPNHVNE
jgi:ubiquitin C-terminal hydrolase